MRIGFIGDIHGDIDALRWALDALAEADRVVSLGDIVDGRHDLQCIALLQERGIMVVQGNHDFWASRGLRMGNQQPDDVMQWLGGLSRTITYDEWLACHSRHDVVGPDVHWEYVVSDASVRKALAEFSQRVVFCGHTHLPAVNELRKDHVRVTPWRGLRQDPTVTLRAGSRYVICAGRPTDCVVLYTTDDESVRFIFQPDPPRPEFTHAMPATSTPDPLPDPTPPSPALRWWRLR